MNTIKRLRDQRREIYPNQLTLQIYLQQAENRAIRIDYSPQVLAPATDNQQWVTFIEVRRLVYKRVIEIIPQAMKA